MSQRVPFVAPVATWLILRTFAKGRNPGCGGACACPASEFKATLKK